MLRSIKQLAGCIAALTVIGTGAAFALSDCPHGELDKDLLRSEWAIWSLTHQTESKQFINPSTRIAFALRWSRTLPCRQGVGRASCEHAEKVTGKPGRLSSQYNPAPPRSRQCARGRLHISRRPGTGPTPIAVNCAGYVPFAIMGAESGTFGYEMEIIVAADSPIKTAADLKGKKVAFTAPTSNSSFKARRQRFSRSEGSISRRSATSRRCSPAKHEQLGAGRRQQGLRRTSGNRQ